MAILEFLGNKLGEGIALGSKLLGGAVNLGQKIAGGVRSVLDNPIVSTILDWTGPVGSTIKTVSNVASGVLDALDKGHKAFGNFISGGKPVKGEKPKGLERERTKEEQEILDDID